MALGWKGDGRVGMVGKMKGWLGECILCGILVGGLRVCN